VDKWAVPDKWESFIAVWRERAAFFGEQPGFRSLRLVRAVSARARFQAVTIQECDDIESLQAATRHDRFQRGARLAVRSRCATSDRRCLGRGGLPVKVRICVW